MTLLDTLNEKTCTLKDYASYEAYTGRVHLTHNPDTSTPVTSSYFAQYPTAVETLDMVDTKLLYKTNRPLG